jgi:hypothetical protein
MVLLCAAGVGSSSAQTSAVMVYGQADFSGGAVNRGGAVAAGTLHYPLGLALDNSGGIYVADRNNHRVLYYASDGNSDADRVYGQHGSMTAHIANNDGQGNSGAPSADNLSNPTAVALDSQGGLFVTDRDNHRLLYFAPDGNTSADRVYGQFGSFATNMANNDGTVNYGEPSADNLGVYILGVVVDSQDGVYVSDASNHRVLYYANDGNTTADRVYGQAGDFATAVRNRSAAAYIGAPTADTFNFPRGLALDSQDGLYVADRDNNRVLYFANDGNTTADRVYGQFGNFGTNVESNDGSGGSGQPSADNLSHPKSVAVDASGGVYITDSLHHRIVYFAPDGNTSADRVYGQFGSFASAVQNNDASGQTGAPSADNLNLPQGIVIGADGSLYVTDTGNNRLIILPQS